MPVTAISLFIGLTFSFRVATTADFVDVDDDDVCAKRVYVVLFFNPPTFESFPINVKKLIKNFNNFEKKHYHFSDVNNNFYY